MLRRKVIRQLFCELIETATGVDTHDSPGDPFGIVADNQLPAIAVYTDFDELTFTGNVPNESAITLILEVYVDQVTSYEAESACDDIEEKIREFLFGEEAGLLFSQIKALRSNRYSDAATGKRMAMRRIEFDIDWVEPFIEPEIVDEWILKGRIQDGGDETESREPQVEYEIEFPTGENT